LDSCCVATGINRTAAANTDSWEVVSRKRLGEKER